MWALGAPMTHGIGASINPGPGWAARREGERCSLMGAKVRGLPGCGEEGCRPGGAPQQPTQAKPELECGVCMG